jgi:beta-1,4-mannosyltransferase
MMNEESLLNEYQSLCQGVTKVFVIPKIPDSNKNTSYLYQLYKSFLNASSPVGVDTFDPASLPKIFLSRLKAEKTILHYHWFEFENLKTFIGMKWKLFWFILYKILGGKIIWTIHNRYPHSNKYLFLNKKFRKFFAKIADRLHVHCKSAVDICAEVLDVEKEKFFVVKHPEFPADIFEKGRAIEKLNQKYCNNQLKIDDKIFLMFGAIAEYKRIKEVVEIFKALGEKNKLIVAGFVKRWNQNYFNELKNLADSKRILLKGSLIPDKDVPYFLNSADCVILNYGDVLTSGGIHLALSYKKLIIAPFSGCLKELQNTRINFFEPGSEREENLLAVIKKFAL